MGSFRRLQVWQRAYEVSFKVYEIAATFPEEEKYGLTSQLKRAVMSIHNNIAEGSTREGQQDFIRFLNIAEASADEVENLLGTVTRLRFVTEEISEPLRKEIREIAKMLHAFRNTVHQQKWRS